MPIQTENPTSSSTPDSTMGDTNPVRISSLDELRIELPKDVRRHLESQYEGLYEAEGGDEMAVTAAKRDGAKRHLNRVLRAMKVSPRITTCRVNRILSNEEEVCSELRKVLSRFDDCPVPTVDVEEVDSASVGKEGEGIHVDNKGKVVPLFQVRRHASIPDLIEIYIEDTYPIDDTGTTSLYKHSSPPSVPQQKTKRPNLCESSATNQSPPPTTTHRPITRNGTTQSQWPSDIRVLICDRLCGEAVLRGSNAFVKGILAADPNIRRGDRVALYAHLDGTVKVPRGLKLVDYTGHCVFIAVGYANCSRADMFRSDKGLAVDIGTIVTYPHIPYDQTDTGTVTTASTRAGPTLPPLNDILPRGKTMLQNLPSALVAHALDPQPNDVILDMCAAPGGKTSHVASLVFSRGGGGCSGATVEKDGATGMIVALDRSRKKVIAMHQSVVVEMGASNVVTIPLDATKCVIHAQDTDPKDVRTIVTEAVPSPKDSLPIVSGFYPASFDRILLDPPCSALGLRPKLSLLDNLRLPDGLPSLQKHTVYQRKFIDRAVELLKPGGIMTVSTCTIHWEENEGMVRYVLDGFGGVMRLIPLGEMVEGFGLVGLPGVGLSDEERGMVRRFDPSDEKGDTMGFFIAKFRKDG